MHAYACIYIYIYIYGCVIYICVCVWGFNILYLLVAICFKLHGLDIIVGWKIRNSDHGSCLHSRDRIVVSTLRCGRNNPGSNPGHGKATF